MWTQPVTDEQKRYYSKHSPKRKVYGWIMTLLQTAHGFLAFAAWTSIYLWVFSKVPQLIFLAPILSISTLFALHILFRTTWDTFWYDRLDDDPNTDSSVFMPLAIIALLLFAEVNGARQYLSAQVKPIERMSTAEVDNAHQATISAAESSYERDKKEITAIYKEKERAAAAPFNRQIAAIEAKGEKAGNFKSQRDKAVQAIRQQKADALQAAYQRLSERKAATEARTLANLTTIDNHNAGEVARYTEELGAVGTYAWVLSVALLSLIAGLGYVRVRINVKSGILPLRNYTVLDAHGSVIERFGTAFGDAFNRRSLQLAVWIHKLLSPKRAISSFDGTIVAKPGTYNTPPGFFPPTQYDEDTLRSKVFVKLANEAKAGGLQITDEMLQQELEKARKMNGSYLQTPLSGKTEPSATATSAPAGGNPYPAGEATRDKYLKNWAARVEAQVTAYDRAMRSGNTSLAQESLAYLNNPTGPIRTEAERLGIGFGVDSGDDEVVVWNTETPTHKVPLSMLSEAALFASNSTDAAAPDENQFKYDLNKFQAQVEPNLDIHGNVIGVKYLKDNGTWGLIGEAQIASRLRIQQKYAAAPNPSPKVLETLGKWQYAMSLIQEGKADKQKNMETVLH